MILILPPPLTTVLTRLLENIFVHAVLTSASSVAGSASTPNHSRQRTSFHAVWENSNTVHFSNAFFELLVASSVSIVELIIFCVSRLFVFDSAPQPIHTSFDNQGAVVYPIQPYVFDAVEEYLKWLDSQDGGEPWVNRLELVDYFKFLRSDHPLLVCLLLFPNSSFVLTFQLVRWSPVCSTLYSV